MFDATLLATQLRQQNRLAAVWVVVVVALALACALLFNRFTALDFWLYDHALTVHTVNTQTTDATQPAHPKPLLIEIDEASLQALGRWPWPRQVHAQLLSILQTSQPYALAFDIVFAQQQLEGVAAPDQDGDRLLSSAIDQATFPVILATQLDELAGRTVLVKPQSPLDQGAARFAHIHALPSSDGVLRAVNLYEGFQDQTQLPYLAQALLRPNTAPHGVDLFNTATRANPQSSSPVTPNAFSATGTVNSLWHSSEHRLLHPLSAHEFDRVSYLSVLQGNIPAAQFTNRRILVAATATGLGDQYLTPLYAKRPIVSGGELVMAALLTELKHEQGAPALHVIPVFGAWLCALCFMVALMFGLRRLPIVLQPLYTLFILAALTVCALGMFKLYGVWVLPGASLVGVIACLVCWLLLRLNAVIKQSRPATTSLNINNQGFSGLFKTAPAPAIAVQDPVDRFVLQQAQDASAQHSIRNTLLSILQVLPDAAVVLTPQAKGDYGVWLANQAALQLMQGPLKLTIDAQLPSYAQLLTPFEAILTHAQQTQLGNNTFEWRTLLHTAKPSSFNAGVEAILNKQHYLIKVQLLDIPVSQALITPSKHTPAFVMSVVDLSISQQLSEQRDASLQFLSHDLRTPQAAIIALLDLEEHQHPNAKKLFYHIRHEAMRTLELAEGFVQLARAEQADRYQFATYDLNDLAIEAMDEVWAMAKQRSIAIDSHLYAEPVLVNVDRTMIWRALVNLLSNALKYCPASSHIAVHTSVTPTLAIITITDQGPGIPNTVLDRLFERFNQNKHLNSMTSPTLKAIQGVGLGLAFVKTVVEQHRGHIIVETPVHQLPKPHGTRFVIELERVFELEHAL